VGARSLRPELSEVVEIALTARRPFHRQEMLTGTDEHGDASERRANRRRTEKRIGVIGVDPRHPLHEIEPAVPSCEDEVAALGELRRIERIEREFGCIEVADSVQLAVQSPKHAGKRSGLAGSGDGTMSRSFVARTYPCAATASPPMMT